MPNNANKSPQKPPTSKSNLGIPPRDLDRVNNTLALNNSYAQGLDNNTSFEGKGDLEILSKNIGNISMINNSKIFEPNGTNVSQLEMDDLILKMMLEEAHQKKGLPPTYSHPHHHNHHIPTEPSTQTKVQSSYDNFNPSNVQKSVSKLSTHLETEPGPSTKKVLGESNTNVYQNKNEYKENKYDSKFEKAESKYETYNPSTSSSKLKSSYSSQTLSGNQLKVQNFTSVNEPVGKEYILH